MGTSLIQPSFVSGEISPALYGRVDFAKYYSGLRTCKNYIVRQFGGVSNRPGTRFVGQQKDMSKRARLIPFVFSETQSYVLEFGHLYMRIIKDGGIVLDGSDIPIYITTPYTSTDLRTVADIDLIKFTQSMDVMTLVNTAYQPKKLSRTSHSAWALEDYQNINGPFDDKNIDASVKVTSSAVTGSVTLTASSSLFKSHHVNTYLYLENMPDDSTQRWEVGKAVTAGDIRRAGTNYYQAVTSATTGSTRPSVTEGTESDGSVVWAYLHSGSGIVKILTVATNGLTATATVTKRLPDALVVASGNVTVSLTKLTITQLTPGSIWHTAKFTASGNHLYSNGDVVTISGSTSSYFNGTFTVTVTSGTEFTLNGALGYGAVGNTPLEIVQTNAASTKFGALPYAPTYKWAFSSWRSDSLYPGAVVYNQQRQMFGGTPTKPSTVYGTKVKEYTNFATSNPILFDDAFSATLNTRKYTLIKHFVELTELVMLTNDGPFLLRGDRDGSITPTSINFRRQGVSGVSDVPPITVGNNAVYIQELGAQVRSIGYNFQADAFAGNDLTIMSAHLFYGCKIVDWTYQEVPFSTIWAVRDDGILLGLTYMPEQEIIGWHRHETDGEYESVCCITEGGKNVVYATVKRTINGSVMRYIEVFEDRFPADHRDYFFVDCGLSYEGRNTSATTMTLSGGTLYDHTESLTLTASTNAWATKNGAIASMFVAGDVGNSINYVISETEMVRLRITGYTSATVVTVVPSNLVPVAYRSARTDWEFAKDALSGLAHLEGKTVAVVADGYEHPDCVVTAGAITLNAPAAVVHVGLPYNCDLETLELNAPNGNIRDKKKLLSHVQLIVQDSVSIKVGQDYDNLEENKGRSFEGYNVRSNLITGMVDLRIPASWTKEGRFVVRQDKPFPSTILAAIPEVNLGGS